VSRRFTVTAPPSREVLNQLRADVADSVADAASREQERAEISARRRAIIADQMRRQAEAAQKPQHIETYA
jgi:hypothetical protein